MTPKRSNPNRRVAAAAAVVLAGVCTAALAPSAPLPQDTVEEIRTLRKSYIDLNERISAEKKQFAETKVFLTDEISLLEARIALLNESTEEARAEQDGTAEKRAELEAEEAEIDAGMESLRESIAGLEARARAMIATLPAEALKLVEQIASDIPASEEEAEEKGLDLYTRYLKVIGALNQVDSFSDDPIVTLGFVPDPASGREMSVTMIYLGVGQGYYVDEKGTKAGVGRPTPEGFEWTPNNELAPLLKQIEKTFNGGASAEFVQVPVKAD